MPFKVELIADRVFRTREEGEAYARELASRWALMGDWRIVAADEPADSRTAQEGSPASSGTGVFTLTLGPITRRYRSLCTTAPSAYDTGTSITLVTGAAGTLEGLLNRDRLLSLHKDVPARLVLVEANQFEWHRARYSSGLYASAEPDPDVFGLREVAAELLHRLERGTPSEL